MTAAAACEGRAALATSLRARRDELAQTAWAGIRSVRGPEAKPDPVYSSGLRAAVDAALDLGILAIERGEDDPPAVPDILLRQARLAAQSGVTLDTVLRRYFAGFTLVAHLLIQGEESRGLLRGEVLNSVVGVQTVLFDRLIAAVTEEYSRASEADSPAKRRARSVKKLLAGQLVDPGEIAYEFGGQHLGLVANGPDAREALRDLISNLNCRALLICPDERSVWAWLGSRKPIDPALVQDLASISRFAHVSLAVGEPAEGLAGWRLTHRQAKAALPIALRAKGFARYRDTALLATLLTDDLLATSLYELYLKPLANERDGGVALRETLCAYLAADQNVSSAAAAMGMNRHTVAKRLRNIEERIGRPLSTCAGEMAAVLSLEKLGLPTWLK